MDFKFEFGFKWLLAGARVAWVRPITSRGQAEGQRGERAPGGGQGGQGGQLAGG